MVNAIILTYPESFTAGAAVVGGKGWNLGRLHRYGFRVPVGGVVAADVYRTFMSQPDLAERRQALADVSAEDAARADVAERLRTFREVIAAAHLPDDTADAMQSFFEQHGLTNQPVAVRSSAVAEDGTTASFAGIHESVLNVVGIDNVLPAIKQCYASLWTPQAVSYRRHLKLTDDAAACAVVICAMVNPVCAGVAFSADPRTGRRDLIVINATAGLGDALVSGRVNPDEIAVRYYEGKFQTISRSKDASSKLPNERVAELARLTLRIQWALGDGQDPQDIEWAFDGREFWLLQARPVTRLPRRTSPVAANQPLHWSNANVKDALPGVLSCMSWSMVLGAINHLLYAIQDAVRYPVPEGLEVMRRFSGRVYFDLTTMQAINFDSLGLAPAELNRSLGGHQPEIVVPAGNPFLKRGGLRRLVARLKIIRRLWGIDREVTQAMKPIRERVLALRSEDLSGLTQSQLLDRIYDWSERGLPFNTQFQLANGNSAVWLNILRQLLDKATRGNGNALATRLLSGTGEVTSAEHGYRLIDLASIARTDAAAQAVLSDRDAWKTLPVDSPFRIAFEEYLREYGHRTVYEAEIANPRWYEDPSYLLEQVRYHLAAPSVRSRSAATAAGTQAQAELRRATLLMRPLVRWLARRARRGMALREAAKSTMAALMEGYRRFICETGRRIAAANALDAEDVYHLSFVDLEAYLLGEWDGSGARTLTADRKAQRTIWLAESPPDVISNAPDAVTPIAPVRQTPTRASSKAADGVWTGMGVAPGRATGAARVIRHPNEGDRLRHGEVLVAPSTDPGWTPLFLRASAVVMETGGYLSHGAIVAREYGLPAVVNISSLLDEIADGDVLDVDGDAGRVVRGG